LKAGCDFATGFLYFITMIQVENLQKTYGKLHVLKGMSLSVQKGEVVSITGPSGAGKTTLLQIIGTLDHADSGTVSIAGTEVNKLSDKALSAFRNQHIGFVFQFHHLLPEFTAIENICLPGYIAGRPQKQVEKEAKDLLDFLGLAEREKHHPGELSGGEQQRVAVARALINKPSLILADEPTGNLDSKNADDMHKLFFQLRDTYGQTFMIVTHNASLAEMADRTIKMKDGRLE
jgi:lipoprotein-releasing system ATP-binding protein